MDKKTCLLIVSCITILVWGVFLGIKFLRNDKDEKIVDVIEVGKNTDLPETYEDNGIFTQYYKLAYEKLKTMNIDQKIAQLLLVHYPDNALDVLSKYQFGGFVFFEKDFSDKNQEDVKNEIKSLQQKVDIPLLTAVDEEGGEVVRVSSNPLLIAEKFKSSQELYNLGGLELIKEDTITKSKFLYSLGLNLNLAPVVDVSLDSTNYIYKRALGENTTITSNYAKAVIEASKKTGVSYTLKHFPGYANNTDTHLGSSIDPRSYEDVMSRDIPPFTEGIKAGAEAILISHNIISSMDAANPASLSKNVHELLRDDLSFSGVIISDDLSMKATSKIADVELKAIKAGNDLIITTYYEQSFNALKDAYANKKLSDEEIDKKVFRILAWKYYKGLMFEVQK